MTYAEIMGVEETDQYLLWYLAQMLSSISEIVEVGSRVVAPSPSLCIYQSAFSREGERASLPAVCLCVCLFIISAG